MIIVTRTRKFQKPAVVSKKVKRKDPIVFDISDALKSKSAAAQDKKPEAKKKAESSAAPARNVLDSVPVKLRRGKERLTPKKKRPTTMRKIILADRYGHYNCIFSDLTNFSQVAFN